MKNNYINNRAMMLRTIKSLFVVFMLVLFVQSCADRLDLQPEDERLTAQAAFDDPDAYKQFLAKLYAGISLSGQQGPSGSPDLAGLDEGFSNYLRLYWKMQELTTDEAIIGWNDGTIQDLHGQVWTSGNEFIRTMYSRIMYQVALTNEFLRQTTDEKLSSRGVEADLRAEIQTFRAEARFMRALSYWHAMDLFANPPFVTEDDPVGAFFPPQIQRGELFAFIETELLDIIDDMAAPRQNEYGRADRGAAWMVLAKLYLNSEVYTGTSRYADVITYVNNIVGAGYSIPDIPYFHSFLADNDSNGAQDEVIFTIPFDGLRTQAFGGMTFLVHAPVGGTMDPADFGINGGWFGIRTTPTFVDQFSLEDFDTASATSAVGALSDWGLIGSGTPNGWDGPDIPMAELSTNVYQGYINFTDGEMKFRFNNDWSLNYGTDPSSENPFALSQDGPNIPVSEGLYKVTLDLNTLTYSFDSVDGRELLYTDGQNKDIEEVGPFNQGYAVAKYRNVDVNGNPGSDSSGDHTDIDFPMFRLADAYLMYAEAVVRGGGGSMSTAVEYVNEIRQRAYGNAAGNISESDLTLDFIIDERSRELFFEGHRRTDLIRFGQFSDSGIWQWKGNVQQGTTTESFRDLMPIPATDLGINTNLTQNPGY
ncbi:RagB/SusD family nutrient uptake outer membrane protein [Winogradskyella poriferorum]|uniref:RagB/SusD family nutrient uptake outer membrane protein n=1 Tax=Winogradskyella poriferorum TaxID=307627 RepID=UPI003D658EED